MKLNEDILTALAGLLTALAVFVVPEFEGDETVLVQFIFGVLTVIVGGRTLRSIFNRDAIELIIEAGDLAEDAITEALGVHLPELSDDQKETVAGLVADLLDIE